MRAYIKRTKKSQINNATSQTPRKTRTNKTQNKQKERNNKIRAKMNEIGAEKMIQRINETKAHSFKNKIRLTSPWQI
jgi:hypothetical protein